MSDTTEATSLNEYTDAEAGITIKTDKTCPKAYASAQQQIGWVQGLIAGKAYHAEQLATTEDDPAPEAPENPYRFTPEELPEGLTSTDWSARFAPWKRGFEDWSYEAAPFNPANFDDLHEHEMAVSIDEVHDLATDMKYKALVFSYPYYSRNKPAWQDNRPEHRSIKLGYTYQNTMMMNLIRHARDKSIDLPCPPYEYEYSAGGMEISAGAFKKWGSKDDWERVVAEMQEKIEEMPTGLDIEDETVDIDVSISANVTVSVPMSSVVAHNEYVFEGDKDELHDALVDGVGNLESWEITDYMDTSYIEWEVDDASATDVDYAVRNVGEV